MRLLVRSKRFSFPLTLACSVLGAVPLAAQPAAGTVEADGGPTPGGAVATTDAGPPATDAGSPAPAVPDTPEAPAQRAPTPGEIEAAVVARIKQLPPERVAAASGLPQRHAANLARVNRIEKLAMETNDNDLLALSRRLREMEIDRNGKARQLEERLLRVALVKLPPVVWDLGPPGATQAGPADAGPSPVQLPATAAPALDGGAR